MVIDLLPLFVALPLGAGFFIPLVSRRLVWMPDLLGNLVMGVLSAMALLTMGSSGVCHIGSWGRLGVDLRLDGLTSLMLIVINVVSMAAAIFSVQYMTRYTSKLRYYSLFMFLIAGLNGVALSNDIFAVYVFMEITTICSYALVAFGCEHDELEASFKYAVMGSLTSSFILLGIAITYGMVGTLNMTEIAQAVKTAGMSKPLFFALGLFICGFGLKAALVPFHAWLPGAHPSAPAPVSAMLSGVVVKTLGIYTLCRIIFNVFGASPELLMILRWLGLFSMILGVVMAIGQWDIKRLFAYSTISQIGYVAVGLGLGTPLGIVGGLFHLANHSVIKSLLFLNAGAVEYATGTRDLKRLGGLNKAMPVTGATSLIASMSVAGIPPLNGFWSKLIIVIACVQSHHYWLALWAVLASLLTLAAVLKVQKYAFYDAAKTALDRVREVPLLMRTAMILLCVLCVALSLVVLTGLERPFLVNLAADALTDGIFTVN